MHNTVCKTCAYFYQHYALKHQQIFQVHCGHCTHTKVKRKQPDSAACENYAPAEPDEAAFATKEYLSKELLQYILHLDPLPEIKNLDNGRFE